MQVQLEQVFAGVAVGRVKKIASPWSSASPRSSRIVARVALRGRNAAPVLTSRCAISRTAGPLTRTTAMAPFPGGVAIAAIVSPGGTGLTGMNDHVSLGFFAFGFGAHELRVRER